MVFIVAGLAIACGEGPDETIDRDLEPEACEPGFREGFTLGTVTGNAPDREFTQYDDGCNDVEVISGFQGGYHIEPAIGSPAGSTVDTLGGVFRISVLNDGEKINEDAEFVLESRFWQPAGEGFVYWGDTIVLNGFPDLDEVELVAEIETDDESVEVRATVWLVDDDAEGG